MTKNTEIKMNMLSMMESSYFYFTKARFFAGLFAVQKNPVLSDM